MENSTRVDCKTVSFTRVDKTSTTCCYKTRIGNSVLGRTQLQRRMNPRETLLLVSCTHKKETFQNRKDGLFVFKKREGNKVGCPDF